MRLLSPGDKIVVATHNKGKLIEISELLVPLGYEVLSAKQLNLSEPEESGNSFAENAILKANFAAEISGLPSLSDDSGLCVDALNGDPGIYSARWAGENKDFFDAMRQVVEKLNGNPQRSAHFHCALCIAVPSGNHFVFEGRVDGQIVWPPRGDKGFGYDPIFQPENHDITFGEMDPAIKHAMSHRAKAFAKLLDFLK